MDVDLAVVTGGAGGLGRLITRRLAERGMCVVIADTDHAAATQLVTELRHRGRGAVFVDTDAADAEAVERLMTQLCSPGGAIGSCIGPAEGARRQGGGNQSHPGGPL